MNGYVKKFKDKKTKITTTTMSLIVEAEHFLKKYNKVNMNKFCRQTFLW